MPHWFWQQSTNGFLGPNLKVDFVTQGYRVLCWESVENGYVTGLYFPASKLAGELQPEDARLASEYVCRTLRRVQAGQ